MNSLCPRLDVRLMYCYFVKRTIIATIVQTQSHWMKPGTLCHCRAAVWFIPGKTMTISESSSECVLLFSFLGCRAVQASQLGILIDGQNVRTRYDDS